MEARQQPGLFMLSSLQGSRTDTCAADCENAAAASPLKYIPAAQAVRTVTKGSANTRRLRLQRAGSLLRRQAARPGQQNKKRALESPYDLFSALSLP